MTQEELINEAQRKALELIALQTQLRDEHGIESTLDKKYGLRLC